MGIARDGRGRRVGSGATGPATEGAGDPGPTMTLAAQIRPMGPNARFGTRSVADACWNCGQWIHPRQDASYDPDLDESLCTGCWPEAVVVLPHD